MNRLWLFLALGMVLSINASASTLPNHSSTYALHDVSLAPAVTAPAACCGGDPGGGGSWPVVPARTTVNDLPIAAVSTPAACCGGDPGGGGSWPVVPSGPKQSTNLY
jgi:hypothetical protein